MFSILIMTTGLFSILIMTTGLFSILIILEFLNLGMFIHIMMFLNENFSEHLIFLIMMICEAMIGLILLILKVMFSGQEMFYIQDFI